MKYLLSFILILTISLNLHAQKGLIKKARKWYNKAEIVQTTSGPRYENHWKDAFVINNAVIVPNSIVGMIHQNKSLDLYWFLIIEFSEGQEVSLTETLQIISRSKIDDVSFVLRNRKSDIITGFDGSLIFQDINKENPPQGIVYKNGAIDVTARSAIRAVKRN
jgi:hypothetical protein